MVVIGVMTMLGPAGNGPSSTPPSVSPKLASMGPPPSRGVDISEPEGLETAPKGKGTTWILIQSSPDQQLAAIYYQSGSEKRPQNSESSSFGKELLL